MVKPVLDACCGGRMFWHDKTTPGVVFMDCRAVEPVRLSNGQTFAVAPDLVADFRAMPFRDGTFRMVVFDPPHLTRLGADSYMALKYGRLFGGEWREDIHEGFTECLRVLDPTGFLIFKWSETRVPLHEVLELAPHPPLFGDRRGLRGTTHWLVFAQSPT